MFEIAKNQTKKKIIFYILKNALTINLACNTLTGKIEIKGTLLGEKSKIA